MEDELNLINDAADVIQAYSVLSRRINMNDVPGIKEEYETLS